MEAIGARDDTAGASAPPSRRAETAVVADDLTGACDAAIEWVRAGRRAVVGLGAPPEGTGYAVVGVSTETRDDTHETAARETARAMAGVHADRVLIKVDSRLRGPLGAQLAAALDARGAAWVVLAPAAPALGRTVIGGRVHLHGTPEVLAPQRVAATSDLRCALVAASGDPSALASAWEEAAATGARVLVCDAQEPDHLDAVAAAADLLAGQPLLAGSSGLARALAGRVAGRPARPDDRVSALPRVRRVLFVLGSPESPLRRQLRCLLDERRPVRLILGEDGAIPSGDLVVLDSLGHTPGAAPERDGGEIALALARRTRELHEAQPFDALVCTGGAVAAAVWRALGIAEIELVTDLGDGLVVGRAPAGGPVMALRSGSFGQDDHLVTAYDALTTTR